MQIAVVAPSCPIAADDAAQVKALAGLAHPGMTLHFHDQCFASHGHFAGPDQLRLDALVAAANDPAVDAVWFARGGYGAARIAAAAVAAMGPAARAKAFLGYSDQGNLLAALYRDGFDHVAHGPLVADIRRDGGQAAVLRALDWLATRRPSLVCSSLLPGERVAAFNLMTLSMLLGTPLEPDLTGHVLLLEEVSEYLYAFDRAMFHVTSILGPRGLAGLRLGRVSQVPDNDRPFGMEAEEIARHWCAVNAIPWLGRADIGHDADNKIVPFGLFAG